jgi:Mn2+/Fe2+ NRAMP family transporter
MGWESGVNKDFEQAPQFFWLFTIIIAISAGLILIPNAPLMSIMFISQVVNGAVLPFVLIFMIKLINDKNLMGSYTNKPAFNTIAWLTVVTMIALTVVMTIDVAFPGFIKQLFSF